MQAPVRAGSAVPGGAVTELWSLRADVLVESADEGEALTLYSRWGEIVVKSPGPTLRALLHRMQLGPTRLENVLGAGRLPPAATGSGRAALLVALARLQHLVVRSLATADGAGALLSVEAIARRARFRPLPVPPDLPLRLSSYTVLRTEHGTLQAESPLSLHRALLHGPEAALLAALLARPRTRRDLTTQVALPAPLIEAALSYLLAAGLVVQARDAETGESAEEAQAAPGSARFAEDEDPVLRLWSCTDLLFHSRSTLGRHDADAGATHPFGYGPGPEPNVRVRPEGGRVALHRPRFADVLAADPPFTAVLEARRSIRHFDPARPMTVRELGDLLYRALRIRARTDQGADPESDGLQNRPHPAGGSVYELEYYLLVEDCDDLEPGLYAYDPLRHDLVALPHGLGARAAVRNQARQAADLEHPPPVLLLVTARFGRMFWRYTTIGYSLILKNTGVALLTVQLVATALGLAACPLGGVDLDAVAELLGADWRAESGVGAIMLGRPAEGDEEDWPSGMSAVDDADWHPVRAAAHR